MEEEGWPACFYDQKNSVFMSKDISTGGGSFSLFHSRQVCLSRVSVSPEGAAPGPDPSSRRLVPRWPRRLSGLAACLGLELAHN